MKIEMGKFFFWNFRAVLNMRLFTVKHNEHRPAFIHCVDDAGKEYVVHIGDLSEERK